MCIQNNIINLILCIFSGTDDRTCARNKDLCVPKSARQGYDT